MPPSSRTGCCARWRRWKTCASAPTAKSRTRALTPSRHLRATCWASPTTCAGHSTRYRRNCAQAPSSGVKALIEGVELTERELQKALEKNGVSQFTPRGEKFDPNVHQAMFEVPDAAVPAGSVVEVVQPGYMIGERMLRPALVGVSKGGPKTAPARGQAAVNDNAAKAAKDS